MLNNLDSHFVCILYFESNFGDHIFGQLLLTYEFKSIILIFSLEIAHFDFFDFESGV